MKTNCLTTQYEKYGLVDITSIQPSIQTDIRYATTNNFTGKILYLDNVGAYAEPVLAHAVAQAQNTLKSIDSHLSLVILDAARPISVQKEMFKLVKGTVNERFVANPYGKFAGGFHNYGMAVDVAIVNNNGNMLDFGTGYDSFEDIAHSGGESELTKRGLLSPEAYINRQLLYYVMGKHGMLPYVYEWWHFQLTYKEEDKMKYHLLDF